MVEIKLFSRRGCHLCEVALEDMKRIATASQISIKVDEVFIDGDPALESEYGFMVPVIHVDGVMHGYGRIEEARFLKAISAL
jgi:glutaredoxin